MALRHALADVLPRIQPDGDDFAHFTIQWATDSADQAAYDIRAVVQQHLRAPPAGREWRVIVFVYEARNGVVDGVIDVASYDPNEAVVYR